MITIGRTEKVKFGSLYAPNTFARIDTGAYHCSLGCEVISVKNNYVTFKFNNRNYTYPVVKNKIIKNANGKSFRYFIELEVSMGQVEKNQLFSLSDRSGLKYQVLIGRKFLTKNFIVDVSKTFMLGK